MFLHLLFFEVFQQIVEICCAYILLLEQLVFVVGGVVAVHLEVAFKQLLSVVDYAFVQRDDVLTQIFDVRIALF